MALYHFSVKVISRATGRSAVAAAAYRSASRLNDERLDRDHDFSNKAGVVHSEVMLPEDAPEEWRDRERLWNDVEAFEKRKDAQLAREVEFAIPREMSQADGIELARDFVQAEFVDEGMIADLNVHWDVGEDGQPKPHAHVMLTMRDVDANGFGAKNRDWNRTEMVERWRGRWADHVNARLAERDIDARIDHRSLEAQGIDLEPQNQIGGAAERLERDGLASERADAHREIARRNGERIVRDPRIGLDAITHQQSTFTRRDMAMVAHRHSDGQEQFDAVMGAMRGSPDLVELGPDGRGDDRYTTREMIEAEQRLHRAAELMAERERHRVDQAAQDAALAHAAERDLVLSGEQGDAFAHVTDGPDLAIVVGYAGTGKSAMLGVAREAWEKAGYNVRGAALSGIAAEGLENGSGIASRTLASLEHGWEQGRDLLNEMDVLVIDEAGMVGTRQMERVLSHAAAAGAKVVMVGDPEQLQSIEAGAAFRSVHERHGGVEIGEVRRQRDDWQRKATRHLATGRTADALGAYDEHGMVHEAETREQARGDMLDRWGRDRQAKPDATRIMLAHTNEEVQALNAGARERMHQTGELGDDVHLAVERGERDFAAGDRAMFLRNERSMGVRNGTLGTVTAVSETRMSVQTDQGRAVDFDIKDYRDIDHGYAATLHKTQSMTVDRTHVLATRGMDRHATYVGLSRHRDGVDLHYGRDDFADRDSLSRTLSRERTKDMASDYARPEPERAYAERRGISFRERIVEVMRKVPEKMRDLFDGLDLGARGAPRADKAERGMFDGLCLPPATASGARPGRRPERESGEARSNVPQPRRGPEDADAAARAARTEALKRHARAVDAVFRAEEHGGRANPEQRRELADARLAFEAVRPHGPRDAEAAYVEDPEIAAKAAAGDVRRAVRAIQLETEIRLDPAKRADRFVERWQAHELIGQRQYAQGDMSGYKATRAAMGSMAQSLERDPQLESLLAGHKAQLGIMMETGRPLGAELAFNHGIDIARGRGIGL